RNVTGVTGGAPPITSRAFRSGPHTATRAARVGGGGRAGAGEGRLAAGGGGLVGGLAESRKGGVGVVGPPAGAAGLRRDLPHGNQSGADRRRDDPETGRD